MIWILHFHKGNIREGEAEYIAIFDHKPTEEEREPEIGFELLSQDIFIGDLDGGFPTNREFAAR